MKKLEIFRNCVFIIAVILTISVVADVMSENESKTNMSITEAAENNTESNALSGLEVIEQCKIIVGSDTQIVSYCRDKKTDVMYIYITGYRKAGLTVILNPETGLPMTYSEYIKTK